MLIALIFLGICCLILGAFAQKPVGWAVVVFAVIAIIAALVWPTAVAPWR